MTISTTTRKTGPYLGNGSQTRFDFAFKVFKEQDILVTYTDGSGIESSLVFGTDYQVTLLKDQENSPGGYVTTTTPPASGSKITITSNATYLQPVKLTNQGGFFPDVINNALDRLTIYTQQLAEQVKRSVKVKVSDDSDPDDLIHRLESSAFLAQQAASAAQTVVDVAQQAANDAQSIAAKLAHGLEDLNGVIKKTDIATEQDITNGVAGKVVDAVGLKAAIATEQNITDGTDGKLVDAQGLKNSGITKARIETIHGKIGGVLNPDSKIILISKGINWSNGAWNNSPEFITRLDVNHECSLRAWIRPNLDSGCLLTYRDNIYNTDFLFKADGTGWCQNGWTSGSDKRLKTDIEPVKNPLEKIKQLNGYTFKLNGRAGAGVIAQELLEILPEAVTVGGDVQMRDSTIVKDALSVDYGAISCLYVEAIKELLDRVEKLENKNDVV